ncbi:MAG: glycosyltransferase N-terminal domain-containing protein [Phycisphaerales bacterium]|nr:glycosyltransferase N-terminal domain-containing protein [Phycisphaerales bacterium]
MPFIVLSAISSRLRGHPPRSGWKARLGAGKTFPKTKDRILLHAVSVGEVNAIRGLVENLTHKGRQLVISVTTDTGIARAEVLFGKDHPIVRYPLDFSWSVNTFLNRMNPSIIVLVELEVWPNMLRISKERNIPVVVVNGRLSDRSYKRYKLVSRLLNPTFGRISAVAMQNELYSSKAQSLGAQNVSVLGTMKWDNAIIRDTVDGAEELAADLGIDRNKPLIVAGSTTPEEHLLLLESIPEGVQLLVAPRRPEWFSQAEKTFSPCNKRTNKIRIDTRFFVLDTIGELTLAYALADIAVIGRSFVPLHGSDPTEPIGLGKPTIIGPNVSDFDDIVRAFHKGNGIVQCENSALADELSNLLNDKERRKTLVKNGRKVIESNQGATKEYAKLIEKVISS